MRIDKVHLTLIGLHITILGGFLLIDDNLTWQLYGGSRADLPVVLLYGGLLLTLGSLVLYITSEPTEESR